MITPVWKIRLEIIPNCKLTWLSNTVKWEINVFDVFKYQNTKNDNLMFYSHKNGVFRLTQTHRQPSFTERKQTRAYTIDDVVGAVGGYIGLFMGYALVQFPKVLRSIYYLFKRDKTDKNLSVEF